jgi:solute carrier family 35 protein E3
MNMLARVGFFVPKKIPAIKLIPIAMGFVGYVVLCNVSLNINSVGFYQVGVPLRNKAHVHSCIAAFMCLTTGDVSTCPQIMKIAIAPTVVVMEFFMFSKLPSRLMILSVLVVCAGITVATVSDTVAVNNMMGLVVGVAATLVTALYQIWAGSKQRELQANSSQLLHAYTPHAVWLLGILVPIFEPIGWTERGPNTLLGFNYTWDAVLAIVISALLGILVSLSTFLVIGTTSSLTYNIVSTEAADDVWSNSQ